MTNNHDRHFIRLDFQPFEGVRLEIEPTIIS